MSRRLSALGALFAAAGCMLVVPVEDAPSDDDGGLGGAGNAGMTTGGSPSGDAGLSGESSGGSEGGAAGAPSPDGPCSTNAQCSRRHVDEPYRCVDGACVQLLSRECPRVYDLEGALDPDAVFIGAYANFEGRAPEESSATSIYRMAREEFDSDNVQGLPGGRPLVMILCDNDPGTVETSMQHLIEHVQVPAVLAFLQIGDLLRAYERYAAERQVFFMSTAGASRELLNAREAGLLWTMLGSPGDFAAIYASVLARIERDLRARSVDPVSDDNPLRVAFVTSPDGFSAELAEAVRETLRFNGLDIVENRRADPARFLALAIDPDDLEGSIARIAGELTSKPVHVVISAADSNFVDSPGLEQGLLERVESGLMPEQRPYYVFSPLNATQLESQVAPQIENSDNFEVDAARRFLAIGPESAEDPSAFNAFSLRLLQRFGSEVTAEASNLYDAFYFLAFAMGAVTSASQLTGSEIAATIKLLTGDLTRPQYEVGPQHISSVFSALREPFARIRLMGTLGPPDFDAALGTRTQLGSVSCFQRVGNGVDVLRHVLRYKPMGDPASERLEGDSSLCFSE